ncbi:MAG: multidrug ABC transporter ATPase [Microbacterium sp.]
MSRQRNQDRIPDGDVPEAPIRAIDRLLAFAALFLAAASILCFFAIIIGTAVGMDQEAFGGGPWPVIAAVPLYGLPLAFVMIIALLIMSFVRKGRAAKRS